MRARTWFVVIFILVILNIALPGGLLPQASAVSDNSSVVSSEAAFWKAHSTSDQDFVRIVNSVVERQVKYVALGTWDVKSPERTMIEKTGDCSEKALLKVAMLTSQGINAQVVYGTMNGITHDTVEVRLGKYVMFINPSEQGVFLKSGNGLHPKEVIIN